MHIEDLIILLSVRVQMNPYDSKIVQSFYDQISRGHALTEKQADLSIKILNRQLPKLNQQVGRDLSVYLQNPTFRLGRRTVSSVKRISVINYRDFGRAIKVEFPYNENLLKEIRETKHTLAFASWDKDEKSWIFSLDEHVIEFLTKFIEKYEFSCDEEFKIYLKQIQEIKDNCENHIPMISREGERVIFKNAHPRTPQPEDNDLLSALFLARKTGITVRDDSIEQEILKNNYDPIVKDFLDSNLGDNFEFHLEDRPLSSLNHIVKYLFPSIFVIPGGSELENLEKLLNLVKDMGVDNLETSVLFRLPNETGGIFNKFVKDNHLNNPVNKNTKVVFISSKIPKTIIDPEMNFHSVVNFGVYNVHYTIREFLKYHHNVIHILEKKAQRRLNFEFM